MHGDAGQISIWRYGFRPAGAGRVRNVHRYASGVVTHPGPWRWRPRFFQLAITEYKDGIAEIGCVFVRSHESDASGIGESPVFFRI